MRILKSDHALRVQQAATLKKYSRTPGLARESWEDQLHQRSLGSDEPVLTLRYGGTKISVNSDGDVLKVRPALYSEDGDEVLDPGLSPDDLKAMAPGTAFSGCPDGAAPANKKVGDVIIPCGGVLIIGQGGAGKTPFAHALALECVDECALVPAGEPLAGYHEDEFTIASDFAKAMVKYPNVVFDSVKDRLSEGSNPFKSGISRSALIALSSWSARACEMGVSVYFPINPSVPDDEVIATLVEASNSNATCTVTLSSVNGSRSEWRIFKRTGEALLRETGTITMDFKDDVSYIVTSSEPGGAKPEGKKNVEVQVDTSTLTDAIRRALVVSNK